MESRRSRIREEEAESRPPAWTATFGNLFLILFAFFVMLYAAPSGPTTSRDAQAGSTVKREASLSDLAKRLEARFETNGAKGVARIEVKGSALIVHMDAGALFDSGRAEFKQGAVPALDAVGEVLAQVGNHLAVEGHTDSDPMRPNQQYPDNWALSGARAAGVLRYLQDFHQIDAARMSMAGYADTHPIADESTPEGKAQNRRVDIVIFGR